MALVYASMLGEVRDAAGGSGEFHTPRPIIRVMVQQVGPELGEIVLDPACGTGGFPVETLGHLVPQIQTAQQRRKLHNNARGTPFGGAEAATVSSNWPRARSASRSTSATKSPPRSPNCL